jgi:hypothetical protein
MQQADIDRVARNDALWLAVALGAIALAVGIVVTFDLPKKAWGIPLVAAALALLTFGLAAALYAIVDSKSAKERPRIVAKLASTERGLQLEASVNADGLRADEHILIRVEGRTSSEALAGRHAGSPTTGHDPPSDVVDADYYQLLYAGRVGPDQEGKVASSFTVPLSPGLYERLVVSAEDVADDARDAPKGLFTGTFAVDRVRVRPGGLAAEGRLFGDLTDETGAADAVQTLTTLPLNGVSGTCAQVSLDVAGEKRQLGDSIVDLAIASARLTPPRDDELASLLCAFGRVMRRQPVDQLDRARALTALVKATAIEIPMRGVAAAIRRCDRASRLWGCVSLLMPQAAARPQLLATWKLPLGKPPVLNVDSKMASLNPADAIVVQVRTSPRGTLNWQPIYKIVIAAESLGGAAAAFDVPIATADRRVCVTAFAVPPSRSGNRPPAVLIRPEKPCPVPREGVAAAELVAPSKASAKPSAAGSTRAAHVQTQGQYVIDAHPEDPRGHPRPVLQLAAPGRSL